MNLAFASAFSLMQKSLLKIKIVTNKLSRISSGFMGPEGGKMEFRAYQGIKAMENSQLWLGTLEGQYARGSV